MSEIHIYFEEFKDVEKALDKFREELEKEEIVDCNGFWLENADDVIIVADDRGVHCVWKEKKEQYRSFYYDTFSPNFYPDYGDLLYDLELGLRNRGLEI